jgi:hypothetical protein
LFKFNFLSKECDELKSKLESNETKIGDSFELDESLVEKPFNGGGIKVTNGAWRVPKWRAFVASLVVLLGETW